MSASSGSATEFDVALSVYSSRESIDVLRATIDAARRSAAGECCIVDVIVNGHQELAARTAAERGQATGDGGTRVRVWSIHLGDKAHAWNEYVHRIAPPARIHVFVDGYARITAGLGPLCAVLAHSRDALAATGLPRVGCTARRTAAELRSAGGLHGNVYALRASAMAELRRIGLRLPLGLYRNDSMLGAALSFGLNLFPREWRTKERIALCEELAWEMPTLAWWRPADLRTHFKRRVRQAQGELELAALRDRYSRRKLPFEDLPSTSADLVGQWMQRSPQEADRLLQRSRFVRKAWAQLQRPRDWSAQAVPPLELTEARDG